MLILNDIHIGFTRQTGTTPESREALRTYLFDSFSKMLASTEEHELLIAGDLFDHFEVAPRDWVQTYIILNKWLARGNMLWLMAGNHDWSPKGAKVSSFQMLAEVLTHQYPMACKVVGIDEWTVTPNRVTLLAHCSNQETFEKKLDEVLAQVKMGDRIILHANYKLGHMIQADHALNVTLERAKQFANVGATLYFAHVHQAATDLGGSVVVFGNQWPTSIADCLNNDVKYAHVMSGGLTKVETWNRHNNEGFIEVSWRDLGTPIVKSGFVRVTGSATSEEASAVINAIAEFRRTLSAFVITNSVKVEGIVQDTQLEETFEAASRFDVLMFLRDRMRADQMSVIENVLLKEGA